MWGRGAPGIRWEMPRPCFQKVGARRPSSGFWGAGEDRLPPEKVRAFNRFGFAYARAQKRARNATELEKVFLTYGQRFCELVEKNHSKPADAVYAFSSVALRLFQWAARVNRIKVLEQVSSPARIDSRLVWQEDQLWPGWEEPYPGTSVWQPRGELEAQEWQAADAICLRLRVCRPGAGFFGGAAGKDPGGVLWG